MDTCDVLACQCQALGADTGTAVWIVIFHSDMGKETNPFMETSPKEFKMCILVSLKPRQFSLFLCFLHLSPGNTKTSAIVHYRQQQCGSSLIVGPKPQHFGFHVVLTVEPSLMNASGHHVKWEIEWGMNFGLGGNSTIR